VQDLCVELARQQHRGVREERHVEEQGRPDPDRQVEERIDRMHAPRVGPVQPLSVVVQAVEAPQPRVGVHGSVHPVRGHLAEDERHAEARPVRRRVWIVRRGRQLPEGRGDDRAAKRVEEEERDGRDRALRPAAPRAGREPLERHHESGRQRDEEARPPEHVEQHDLPAQ
jgi:hypothetical protein